MHALQQKWPTKCIEIRVANDWYEIMSWTGRRCTLSMWRQFFICHVAGATLNFMQMDQHFYLCTLSGPSTFKNSSINVLHFWAKPQYIQILIGVVILLNSSCWHFHWIHSQLYIRIYDILVYSQCTIIDMKWIEYCDL